ncbi:hypothetical protein CCHL11_04211 [Colletotrichum chlorophyti]|uniref:Uncharacterized protein n=1 Tax=Colletotrichum chlorophyti TaxID=708187 RepID=A0A1Q8RPS2_9PEZI|nr:hypothetical protein CCHL11_04211 [Colletotrichum chlorophyti]
MSSLVSEFIINPVLRQARRFSEISRTTFAPDPDSSSDPVTVTSDSHHPTTLGAADAPVEPVTTQSPSALEQSTTAPSEPALTTPPRAPVAPPSITVPMLPNKREALPEDDGMGELRKRLIGIQTQDILAEDKARLMHEVLMEGYRKSRVAPRSGDSQTEKLPAGEAWEQSFPMAPMESLKFWQHPLGEPSAAEKFILTADDIRPTYAPPKLSTREEPEGA